MAEKWSYGDAASTLEVAGWRLAKAQVIKGEAEWVYERWALAKGESEAWMELMWVDRRKGRGPSLKHGVYEFPQTGARGEIKAVTGPGKSALYMSVEGLIEMGKELDDGGEG